MGKRKHRDRNERSRRTRRRQERSDRRVQSALDMIAANELAARIMHNNPVTPPNENGNHDPATPTG